MDPLNTMDDVKVGSNGLNITPQKSVIDPFAEDFAPTEPAPQRVTQPNPESEPEEAPGYGAPLSRQENAFLRELVRRAMEQEALAQSAKDFITSHKEYVPCPENWSVISQIITDGGGDVNDPSAWDNAYSCAKQEGLLRLKNASATGNEEFDEANRQDRIAARDRFQAQQREEAQRANLPYNRIETALPNMGVEPPEEDLQESPEAFQARIAAMPIDEARRTIQAAMRNLRSQQSGYGEPAPRRRVPMADFNNRRPF